MAFRWLVGQVMCNLGLISLGVAVACIAVTAFGRSRPALLREPRRGSISTGR